MSPLPFEVLTNGHCQGPKHLVVGDALLRRFGLEYDPEPLLEYISANNPETISLERTRRHRLGLEREFAGLSLAALAWMARNIAMKACETRFTSGNLGALLRFTSTFDAIHAPNIGTLFPVMSARSTECLDMADAQIGRIRQHTSDPDEVAEMITAYMREVGSDPSWLAEYEKASGHKITLAEFADIADSKSYQMLVENLTIWNYPATDPNDKVDDRSFSSLVVYTLGNGNVFGPVQSKWFMQHVDYPLPLSEGEGDVIMFAEDFLDFSTDDVLLEMIVNKKELTKLHLLVGDETVVSVEDEIEEIGKKSRTLLLELNADFVGWPGWQGHVPPHNERQPTAKPDRSLVPASG